LGNSTIAEDREESSFIWENTYDEEERINEYDLSIFIREEGDLYRKYVETHYQKAYRLDEVKEALAKAGMEFVAVYNAFTREAPGSDCERMYVIAREKGK
ncbi:MAG: class I SAM-dependent methyltransferase, partial [Clostridium sp.]|nr:class I SAM-dependent methyltransferase [Clostridium sp.]